MAAYLDRPGTAFAARVLRGFLGGVSEKAWAPSPAPMLDNHRDSEARYFSIRPLRRALSHSLSTARFWPVFASIDAMNGA